MTMTTPWGAADNVENVAPGIQFVSTPSHGGYKLAPERAAMIPVGIEPFVEGTGRIWWEEDVDAAVVALMFREDMGVTGAKVDAAKGVLEFFHPGWAAAIELKRAANEPAPAP